MDQVKFQSIFGDVFSPSELFGHGLFVDGCDGAVGVEASTGAPSGQLIVKIASGGGSVANQIIVFFLSDAVGGQGAVSVLGALVCRKTATHTANGRIHGGGDSTGGKGVWYGEQGEGNG